MSSNVWCRIVSLITAGTIKIKKTHNGVVKNLIQPVTKTIKNMNILKHDNLIYNTNNTSIKTNGKINTSCYNTPIYITKCN